jgi:hypothetical protein
MDEYCDPVKALNYAKRVAFRMSKDPEMGSIAGRCALKALKTFDGTRGVPMKRWIARIVRLTVHYHWRREARRREVQKSELWWEAVYSVDDPFIERDVDAWTWTLLHRYHVEKWCLDAMARQYETSVSVVRRLIREAEGRLREAYGS